MSAEMLLADRGYDSNELIDKAVEVVERVMRHVPAPAITYLLRKTENL